MMCAGPSIYYQQACHLRDEIIKTNETDVSKCMTVATVLSAHADALMEKGDDEASFDLLLDVSDLVVKKRIGRPDAVKELRLSTLKRICAIADKLIIKYMQEKDSLKIAEMRLMKAVVVSKKSINDFTSAKDEVFKALKLYMQVVWKIESDENLYLEYYYIVENCFKTFEIFQKRCKVKKESSSVSQLTFSLASLSITNDLTHSYQAIFRQIAHCYNLAKPKFIQTLNRSIGKLTEDKKYAEVVRICDDLLQIVSQEIFPQLRERLELKKDSCIAILRMSKPS